jgi:L-fuconolactonase
MPYTPDHCVDTHQHLWVMSERSYDWISPDYGVLYGDHRPEDVARDSAQSGITATVLVQAADTYDDTFYMLSVERGFDAVRGVVAWVPFDRVQESRESLELLSSHQAVKGYRNLTHNYSDPRWILQPSCIETLQDIARRNLSLDMVSVTSDHSRAIVELADLIPDLRIVVDHMAKPDIASLAWNPWAQEMAELAKRPNVFVKHSGLNTASAPGWTAKDWEPYVNHCLEHFGSHRMMLGSDWPVSLLAGDFLGVWDAQRESIAGFSESEQDDIFFVTARDFYRLELA